MSAKEFEYHFQVTKVRFPRVAVDQYIVEEDDEIFLQ